MRLFRRPAPRSSVSNGRALGRGFLRLACRALLLCGSCRGHRAGPAAACAVFAALLAAGPAAAQVPTFQPPAAIDPGAKSDSHSDDFPRIAAGVGGVWVLAWQVVGATDMGLGRDIDVVWVRSGDDGKTWSAPKPLSDTFLSDRAEDRQPAVGTDGKGNWILVWSSTEDLQKTNKRDRDVHYAVSSDNALSWSAPRALNTNAAHDWGDDEAPDIATDDKGRWVVVWQSSDSLGNTKGGDRDILFATSSDDGKSWSAPDVVDASARTDTNFDSSPRIATDGSGIWMTAWSTGNASEDRGGFQRGVLVARSNDAAVTWAPPQPLSGASEDDRPDFGPRIAADGRGNWICAWSSGDTLGDTIGRDRDLLYARSSDGGRTWSDRAPLNGNAAKDSGDDDTPELVVDSGGNWVAAWASWDKRGARGADADLIVAMSRDSGASWTDGYPLNSNAKNDRGEDVAPSLATDGAGLWIAAWSSSETMGEVLGRDRDILVATGRFGREIAGPPSKEELERESR